ncbi:putative G-quadruplex DNA unwinding [Lyophyllum shimeji]|uniref:ATP-dependent DNA helicase n=1 Tax=Lyophyllum shimeji TaxID=47721 RepID=A0A9P3PZV2_LYOSH|nr:putative G-quadruplex DNA unwinding [Lyophyllum shimeji]
MSAETLEAVAVLTAQELRDLCRNRLTLSRQSQLRKAAIIEAIFAQGTPEFQALVCDAAQEKRLAVAAAREIQAETRKRKKIEAVMDRRVARRLDDGYADGRQVEEHDTSRFLELPTSAQVKSCYQAFYKATSAHAVRMLICGVCAREVGIKQDGISTWALCDIPNRHRLKPKKRHPAHELFEGLLLEPGGVTVTESSTRVNLCRKCAEDLAEDADHPPQFSLANNLWIGKVPWQLEVLTFPEQLLIALLYPRVYVFKLFPKAYGPRDPSTLQRGMRGTVTSFDLDMDGIASMIAGNMMPRPLSVLPSIISVTFIGLGDLPKRWLRNTFRVRRQFVFEALRWQKEHNTKYYGNIEIDAERIRSLPEDDVPIEITGIVRQSEDTGIIDQESAGYVPDDNDHQATVQGNVCGSDEESTTNIEGSDTVPDVVPLQVAGTIDTDLSKISANELMLWGLANLWKEGQEGGYAVRHGNRPARDFGKPRPGEVLDSETPNFFEQAFPCLYPFGVGGIEGHRDVEVDFSEHVRWSLQYHDRRFRKHETFPFVAFGIQQRRQALHSARVQIRRKNFEKDLRVISTVTVEKLEQARREEEKQHAISDPAVRLLRKHIHAASAHVQGSDQARYQLRSQIWSTSIMLNPPTLWITINPSDLHDPIAQVFAGENIDLDKFLSTLGPDAEKRAQNIASDPYAAAKFFHFLIQTVLKTLFGVEVTQFQVKSGMGVFGKVAAYFGTVEAQGRGTLHLHLLVWLKHAPSADEILELLKTSDFRDRVVAYIRANLRAYLPGLESAEHVKSIPREKEIAYNRPPNPDAADYDEQLKSFELRLARTEQVHTCRVRRCLFPDKTGRHRCKRRAPWERHLDDFILESGQWGPKRLYEFMNGWCPAILVNCRCNNDVKLLTNGTDTRDVTFYTTVYSAKKQNDTYNLSAIMAKGYAYHLNQLALTRPGELNYVDELRDSQRLLIFRLVHAINREQELAAPMVMSYLMGWGDTYRSHHYTPIYWSSFVGRLLKTFPELDRAKQPNPKLSQSGSDPSTEDAEGSQDTSGNLANGAEGEEGNDVITLDFSSSGQLYAKCQFTDYSARGTALESMNLIDFFVNTYEDKLPKASTATEANDNDEDEDTSRRNIRRGRRPHDRIRFLESHPKHQQLCRVRRSPGHNNLPNFIGRYFPRRDDTENYSFYCACMLMLLKTWRNLQTDLKSAEETWEQAFNAFFSSPEAQRKRLKDILAGIQYFHACESAAEASRDGSNGTYTAAGDTRKGGDGVEEDDIELGEDTAVGDHGYTEEGLDALVASQTPANEYLHARLAIELGCRARVFSPYVNEWKVDPSHASAVPATGDDISRLIRWRNQMAADVARQNGAETIVMGHVNTEGNTASVVPITIETPQPLPPSVSVFGSGAVQGEVSLPAVDPSRLREDQRRAYNIVVWHLNQTLAGRKPPPLRMILQGEGGTGKSRVIQTITEAFKARGASHMLLKSAFTGVAASLIDGKTTHVIGGISLFGEEAKLTNEAKAKLQEFWRNIRYLIIDEFSMLAKTFFALLSRNISIGKQGSPDFQDGASFGGVNVVICGDFHQFPPVAKPIREAPYHPVNPIEDSISSQVGRTIYEEFSTVVILKEQMRVSDPVWLDFLRHLRTGHVQEHHITMLRELIVGHPGTQAPDFGEEPWSNASLVTPRHAVRTEWNSAAIRKMCHDSGRQLFVCTAEDTVKGARPLTMQEKYCFESRHLQRNKGKRGRRKADLPRKIELAIGMKVMVTDNIETDLDVTNGARGEVVDIILHPDEQLNGNSAIVHLCYLPLYILVKLHRTRATTLEGLEECVIPVEPATTSYRMKMQTHEGKTTQKTIRRRQFPLTAAYAFTDYRSQGQTLPYVLIDIASPPTGTLTLFNLYVALSRSSGRATIRLLRDFNDDVFKVSHDPALMMEDDRIAEMDSATKLWYSKVIKTA